jgi:hypothetical protein
MLLCYDVFKYSLLGGHLDLVVVVVVVVDIGHGFARVSNRWQNRGRF